MLRDVEHLLHTAAYLPEEMDHVDSRVPNRLSGKAHLARDGKAVIPRSFGFGRRGQTGRVVMDHLRLVKMEIPADVWAFDFGPPSQSLMLGWTPVSNETAYTPDGGYGWGPRGGSPWNGAARDTTFGTTLLQDFCEAVALDREPLCGAELARDTILVGYGAYLAEVFRAGIQSIAKGQTEAAQTIGLNYADTMRFVILPQAIRRILPPLANQFIYIVKMSAFASVIGMQELTRRANELVVTEYRPLEIYSLLILEYLVLVLIISQAVRWLERKMGADERG